MLPLLKFGPLDLIFNKRQFLRSCPSNNVIFAVEWHCLLQVTDTHRRKRHAQVKCAQHRSEALFFNLQRTVPCAARTAARGERSACFTVQKN